MAILEIRKKNTENIWTHTKSGVQIILSKGTFRIGGNYFELTENSGVDQFIEYRTLITDIRLYDETSGGSEETFATPLELATRLKALNYPFFNSASGGSGAVDSVFGRTGDVTAQEGDYSLDQLSDVTIDTPTNNQVLKYNSSTSKFENQNESGGGSGDMTKAVYDPNLVEDDAFDMDNMSNPSASKTTPIDADDLTLWDSVASVFKRLSIANLKTTLTAVYNDLFLSKTALANVNIVRQPSTGASGLAGIRLNKSLGATNPHGISFSYDDNLVWDFGVDYENEDYVLAFNHTPDGVLGTGDVARLSNNNKWNFGGLVGSPENNPHQFTFRNWSSDPNLKGIYVDMDNTAKIGVETNGIISGNTRVQSGIASIKNYYNNSDLAQFAHTNNIASSTLYGVMQSSAGNMYYSGLRHYFENGNTGFGVANPLEKVDVSGNIQTTGDIYGGGVLRLLGSVNISLGADANRNRIQLSGSGAIFRMLHSGNDYASLGVSGLTVGAGNYTNLTEANGILASGNVKAATFKPYDSAAGGYGTVELSDDTFSVSNYTDNIFFQVDYQTGGIQVDNDLNAFSWSIRGESQLTANVALDVPNKSGTIALLDDVNARAKATINVQALTSSPADAATAYFGNLPKAPTTTANISKIYFRETGTINLAEIYCYSGTAGTNEAWSLYIRKNNTTDYLIATVSAATNERVFSNLALNIPIAANDYVEIKMVNPTWVTNPLTCIFGGYLKLV